MLVPWNQELNILVVFLRGRGVIRGNAFEVLTCQTNTNLDGPAVRLSNVSNILMQHNDGTL